MTHCYNYKQALSENNLENDLMITYKLNSEPGDEISPSSVSSIAGFNLNFSPQGYL